MSSCPFDCVFAWEKEEVSVLTVGLLGVLDAFIFLGVFVWVVGVCSEGVKW